MITRPLPATNTLPAPTAMVAQPVDANATSVLSDTAVVQTVTIYDAGKAAPQFSVLIAFVDAAGLADLVSGPGPMTILGMCEMCGHLQLCIFLYLTGLLILEHVAHAAVSNDVRATHAETFPAGVTLETYILPENIGLLRNILYYHIIDGLYPTESLVSGNLTTLSGDTVSVVVSGMTISFNDAYVIERDWMFDNGVAHVIDSVLLPPSDPLPAK
jgi:uncharacterized surface protein with fasciclin (FAS1) repeats